MEVSPTPAHPIDHVVYSLARIFSVTKRENQLFSYPPDTRRYIPHVVLLLLILTFIVGKARTNCPEASQHACRTLRKQFAMKLFYISC